MDLGESLSKKLSQLKTFKHINREVFKIFEELEIDPRLRSEVLTQEMVNNLYRRLSSK